MACSPHAYTLQGIATGGGYNPSFSLPSDYAPTQRSQLYQPNTKRMYLGSAGTNTVAQSNYFSNQDSEREYGSQSQTVVVPLPQGTSQNDVSTLSQPLAFTGDYGTIIYIPKQTSPTSQTAPKRESAKKNNLHKLIEQELNKFGSAARETPKQPTRQLQYNVN